MAAPTLMTTDEYFRTPETVLPAELRFGIMHVADAPTPRHQSAVLDLTLALERHVRERDLGRVWISPIDVVLDAHRALIVQPDLMFIANARSAIVRDRVWGAPDLVIEVLSPHPRIGRVDEHISWFAEYGVRECWLVNQVLQDVTVLEFGEGRIQRQRAYAAGEPIRSAVLRDWSEALSDVLRIA